MGTRPKNTAKDRGGPLGHFKVDDVGILMGQRGVKIIVIGPQLALGADGVG